MEPILENKSVSKETAPQSSGDEDESFPEILTKGGEGKHVKQERESSQPSSLGEKTMSLAEQVQTLVNAESTTMDSDPRDSTSTRKDDQDDQLETTKAEMDEVREENERLKQLLAKIVKDYKTLEMQFFDKLQHEDKKSSDKTTIKNIHYQENEAEMVSLSLGFGVSSSHDEPRKSKASGNSVNKEDIEKSNDELKLGLECKFEHESIDTIKGPSLESNSQEKKEEEPSEIWPPSKVLKTMRSEDDDESLRQSHLKKPRVCVRARCDTPTMNDGCQWRKYGQKIAKGNPCPRAYYRCTVSPNCPVRKQVQRCAQDMSILITTYEGNHNHPLPPSATAMASTTSAAVSMLQSRSSSSISEPTSLAAASTTLPAPLSIPNNYNSFHNMHGLNFTFSQSSRPISPHFYIPNSSFSTSNSHPTVTLDLTAPPNNNNTSQYFNRFSSNSFPSSQRYSSACLNFSSSSSSSLDTNSYFNYGSTPFYNRNQSGSSHFARTTTSVVQEQLSQPFMHMSNYSSGTQSLTDTIAAATKVIAANPTFRSALAAALTSVVGNGAQESGHSSGVEGSSLNLKLGESLFKQNVSVGCASSYSNKSSTMNREQQGSLSLFPSSLPLSKSRSSSGSSDNNN